MSVYADYLRNFICIPPGYLDSQQIPPQAANCCPQFLSIPVQGAHSFASTNQCLLCHLVLPDQPPPTRCTETLQTQESQQIDFSALFNAAKDLCSSQRRPTPACRYRPSTLSTVAPNDFTLEDEEFEWELRASMESERELYWSQDDSQVPLLPVKEESLDWEKNSKKEEEKENELKSVLNKLLGKNGLMNNISTNKKLGNLGKENLRVEDVGREVVDPRDVESIRKQPRKVNGEFSSRERMFKDGIEREKWKKEKMSKKIVKKNMAGNSVKKKGSEKERTSEIKLKRVESSFVSEERRGVERGVEKQRRGEDTSWWREVLRGSDQEEAIVSESSAQTISQNVSQNNLRRKVNEDVVRRDVWSNRVGRKRNPTSNVVGGMKQMPEYRGHRDGVRLVGDAADKRIVGGSGTMGGVDLNGIRERGELSRYIQGKKRELEQDRRRRQKLRQGVGESERSFLCQRAPTSSEINLLTNHTRSTHRSQKPIPFTVSH